jgi:trk system potassium uptake protein TrkA
MFVLIVGGGKVGINTARSLKKMGHEVMLIEQRPTRYNLLLNELGDQIMMGDGTEIWMLDKAGIARADLVVAVTGDDEDNCIIAQVAKIKYAVPKVVARVNNPYNQPTYDLLGVDATICAARSMLSLIQHELPVHKFVHLLTLKRENIEVVELEVSENSPFANRFIADISLPDGVLLSAIMRGGRAVLARSTTELLPGDYVLCLLEPGKEKELIKEFLPDDVPEDVQADADIDAYGDQGLVAK